MGGIAPGTSATFSMLLSSTSGLSEAAILASEAIRFRGFIGGGSDKDLVMVTAVPEPISLLLLGTGVAGLMPRRRLQSC